MIKLLQILSEIKSYANAFKDPKWVTKTKEFISKVEAAPKLNLHIGKYDVDKGQQGFEYSWGEATSGKNIISGPTRRYAEGIFRTLGTEPEKVYNGWYIENTPIYADTLIKNDGGFAKMLPITSNSVNLKSTYITGHYNGIPIIVAQRQTKDPRAGQIYIFSPYAKLYNTGTQDPKKRTPASDVNWEDYPKEELLRKLKIPQ